MNNQAALASLMAWWRAVPPFRRPGRGGHFYMTPANIELYVLGLREQWSRCGDGVLKLCTPYRELLERQARLVVQDIQDWLDQIEATVPSGRGKRGALSAWVRRWRERLASIRTEPLKVPPGDTLGIGLSSRLLAGFRWWCAPDGSGASIGGPLDDLFTSVLEGNKSAATQSLIHAIDTFPESATELHHTLANSPWPAAFLLNWLLSNKGILRVTRRSPTFDGQSAVPEARAWLDQLGSTFNDWMTSKFAEGGGRSFKYDMGNLTPDFSGVDNPQSDAAIMQTVCPVLPSAYLVPPGADALDVRKVYSGASSTLSAAEGQCAVFDFLLSRLEQLERREFGVEKELEGPPMLVVVDGEGRKRVALQVGTSATTRELTPAAANLLYALGANGHADRPLYEAIAKLRVALGKHQRFLVVGKKTGKRSSKNYARCDAPKLQGQVVWAATKENPSAI